MLTNTNALPSSPVGGSETPCTKTQDISEMGIKDKRRKSLFSCLNSKQHAVADCSKVQRPRADPCRVI